MLHLKEGRSEVYINAVNLSCIYNYALAIEMIFSHLFFEDDDKGDLIEVFVYMSCQRPTQKLSYA